ASDQPGVERSDTPGIRQNAADTGKDRRFFSLVFQLPTRIPRFSDVSCAKLPTSHLYPVSTSPDR
ncbi:MAG: hypothetical protein NTX04_10660, partial [Verrucomicrobia bacterium]|nr:hypothetical protein [Verrucomicrobiota bacterium]